MIFHSQAGKKMAKFIIPIMLLLISCSSDVTKKVCPGKLDENNLGPEINSDFDEFAPKVNDGTLYFIQNDIGTEESSSHGPDNFILKGVDLAAMKPVDDIYFPKWLFRSYTTPTMIENNGVLSAIFAANLQDGDEWNSAIYKIENFGKDSTVKKIDEFTNTGVYVSYPDISKNGEYMAFTSELANSSSDFDLFISMKEGNSWSKPLELKNLNTSGREFAPSFDDNLNIFYAGETVDAGFDIYFARFNGSGWDNPLRLSYPINSKQDEFGAVAHDGYIYLSSNRDTVCGDFDIYRYKLCGPVLLDIVIEAADKPVPLSGKAMLSSPDGSVLGEYYIGNTGRMTIEVEGDKEYVLSFTSDCFDDESYVYEFDTPCSDSKTVNIQAKFPIEAKKREFTFEEYDVPFFVSGYYYPNTPENLYDLRLKFKYKLFGFDDSTRYIEEPGAEYDDYSKAVAEALDEVIQYIYTAAFDESGECYSGADSIVVTVFGFADPRGISPIAAYAGDNIDSPERGLSIMRGDNLNNDLLSRLRAYFTMSYIKEKLQNQVRGGVPPGKVIFRTKGMGIDVNEELPDILKRRVTVTVEY